MGCGPATHGMVFAVDHVHSTLGVGGGLTGTVWRALLRRGAVLERLSIYVGRPPVNNQTECVLQPPRSYLRRRGRVVIVAGSVCAGLGVCVQGGIAAAACVGQTGWC